MKVLLAICFVLALTSAVRVHHPQRNHKISAAQVRETALVEADAEVRAFVQAEADIAAQHIIEEHDAWVEFHDTNENLHELIAIIEAGVYEGAEWAIEA